MEEMVGRVLLYHRRVDLQVRGGHVIVGIYIMVTITGEGRSCDCGYIHNGHDCSVFAQRIANSKTTIRLLTCTLEEPIMPHLILQK